ncbi:MAG TPA: CAP domain-containing protein [Chitinophagaceae bacterium]|nr:CAP domain-containing protein [Chitinophagaceae bacterium]
MNHSFLNHRNFLPYFTALLFFTIVSFTPPAGDLTNDVLKQTNQFRKSRGLPALAMRSDLNGIARKHSEDMARGRRRFGHSGYGQREAQVQRLIKPFSAMAENVAYGASTAREVVSMWKGSTGHRRNMLGNYKYIGIGTAKDRRGQIYFTQIFVR